MEDTMLGYIQESGTLVRKNTNNSKNLTKDAVNKFIEREFNRIIIIASGSSCHGSIGARLFMEKILKIKVDVITSFTFNNYETIYDDKTFIIGVSQSGRSINTNDALDKVKANGMQAIGLTGNVDSIMKEHVDTLINWGMGIEKIGFVTKGVATLTTFLDLFALEAGLKLERITAQDYQKYHDELYNVGNKMDEIVSRSLKWYHKNEDELTDLKRVQITGYGTSYAAALEGALKIAETTGHGATGYEMEEYMHGPSIETNNQRTVIVIDSGDSPSQRARLLFSGLHHLTARAYLITAQEYNDPKVLTLPSVPEYFSSLINCIPFQIISALGHDKWINPLEEARNEMNEIIGYKAPKTGRELGL